MSHWLLMFIGVIVGLFLGLLLGKRKCENCHERVNKLTTKFKARKGDMKRIEGEIPELQARIDTLSGQIADVQAAAEAQAAREAALPDADVDLPGVEAKLPDVDVDLPGVEASAAVGGAVENLTSRTQGSIDLSGVAAENITQCPQKLARIKGIGRVYEDKLYQIGIGTFWQVATASVQLLSDTFGIKEFQAVNLEAIQRFAREWAEKTGTEGKLWNGNQPDDLETLPGIGKTYEGRLYDAGICTWAKLAQLSPDELAAILKAPSWNQPDYAAWIAYAKAQIS